MATQSKKNIQVSRQIIGFKDVQLFKDQVIGVGSYGAVCNALCDDLPCAAKIIHPTLIDTASHRQIQRHKEHRLPIKRFEQECEFMSAIRHPNIVQYLGTHRDSATGLPALLMELMDDSLTHFLKTSTKPLPYHVEVNFCRDIILALSFLHSNGIIHRDLSSNNVLLIGTVRAKVTDFGMARLTDLNHQTSHFTSTRCPGSDVYMPPEAVKEKCAYNEKIDCFSFGVITIQILTKEFPNPGDRQRPLIVENVGSVYATVSEIKRRHNHISKIDSNHPLLKIALVCLNDESDKRPSAQMLCKDIKALHQSDLYCECKTANSTCIFSTEIGTGHMHELAMDKTSGEQHTLRRESNAQTLKPSEECVPNVSNEQELKLPSEVKHNSAAESKSQIIMATEETDEKKHIHMRDNVADGEKTDVLGAVEYKSIEIEEQSKSEQSECDTANICITVEVDIEKQSKVMQDNSPDAGDCQVKTKLPANNCSNAEINTEEGSELNQDDCEVHTQEQLLKLQDGSGFNGKERSSPTSYVCCGAELVDNSQGIKIIAGHEDGYPEPDIGLDVKKMNSSSEVKEEVECSKEVQDDLTSSDTPDKPLQRKRKFSLFSRHKKEQYMLKSKPDHKESRKDKKRRKSKRNTSQDESEKPTPKLEEEDNSVQQRKKSRKFFKRKRSKEMRVLMMGLDAAGKTTILYKMKLGDIITTIPTVGFNVETVSYNQMHFTIWDIGGQDKIRQLWQHYFHDTQAVIWVLDSRDHQRLVEARYELHHILDDEEMKDVIVLVYANKQDLPDAMSPAEIQEKMELTHLHNHNWHIQPSSATTGEGLHEGLLWLKLQYMYSKK